MRKCIHAREKNLTFHPHMVLRAVARAATYIDMVIWLKYELLVAIDYKSVLDGECKHFAQAFISREGICILDSAAYIYLCS